MARSLLTSIWLRRAIERAPRARATISIEKLTSDLPEVRMYEKKIRRDPWGVNGVEVTDQT